MLDYVFYENTLLAWLTAAAVTLVVTVGLRGLLRFAAGRLRALSARTSTDIDDIVAQTLDATRTWFELMVGVWAGSLALTLPPGQREVIGKLLSFALMIQMALWAGTAIGAWVERYGVRKLAAGEGAAVTTMRATGFIARLAVWVMAVLVILDTVFEIEITALVAGLGIGGIAVALAVQNVLSDLLGSLSIVLDKPFVAGDFIVVDDLSGTVEHVGLKTTRVRALSGEQLVFANSDLLTSRIRNFKRMFERRIAFSFGLVYQTPRATLEAIPAMVKEIVEAQPQVRFDRAHFARFGASSLDFDVVYYVTVPEFNTYMDIQQAINFEIFRRFEADGIEFAYPTQTLLVQRQDAPPPDGSDGDDRPRRTAPAAS